MLNSSTLRAKPFCTGQVLQSNRRSPSSRKSKEERKAEREEQYQIQQEVLKRRRQNTWQNEVKARRAEVKKYSSDPVYKKKIDDERRKKKEAEKKEDPKFGIIIPLAPFGMPEYDNGERFDLRLPHVDNGWVDEDSSLGKTWSRLTGGLFGGQKKEDKEAMNAKPGKALKGKKK